jgi:DNA-binding transcriptional MerR regulator
MRIRKLAEQTGVTVDTIRFYEKKGLLDHSHFQRSENGYREYTDSAIQRMEMIKHAQAAGFSLTEIGELFGMWQQNQLTDDLIVARLREKQQQIAGKIAQLEQIQHYITDKIQQFERGDYGASKEARAD